MRDIIWTIIGIWILWKIIDAFRSYSSSKSSSDFRKDQREQHQNTTQHTSEKPQQKKGELKPDAGEYVDYEEIK
jgi:hypothetical protein